MLDVFLPPALPQSRLCCSAAPTPQPGPASRLALFNCLAATGSLQVVAKPESAFLVDDVFSGVAPVSAGSLKDS